MKKTISLFLTLLMLLSLMPMATFAEGLNTPSFAINSVEATPGDTVKVSISVKNNPGIASAAIEITFDDGLVLVGAENGDTFPTYMNYSSPGQLDEGKEMTGRCGFSWMLNNPRTLKDSDIKDGIILTLTFRVSDASEIGDVYSITLSSTDGDIINKNLQIVKMQSVQGTITVIDYIPGDVDNDGNIVMLDAITICCYIVDGRRYDPESYAITLNEKAADVDDDGNITMLDAIMICCYIVDGRRTDPESYNIVLKPSTKRCQHEMQATEAKSETCTEDGNIAYWHCTLCDKYFSDVDGAHVIKLEDTVITASGHTPVIDPAVPATETTTGLTEGSHCSVCGVVFREQEVIPMIQPNTASIIYKLVNNDSYLAAQTINNPNPSTYVIGKGLRLNNDLEVPGYTFDGWYDGFGTNATKITTISANETDDVTLFAHWTLVPYTIQYESDLIPVADDTYKVNQSKLLPTPKLSGYTFIGWTDASETVNASDDGKIIKRIPVGTTDNKIYSANWLSDRNKAITYKSGKTPLVDNPLVKEVDNKILFTYEIGEIQNVPVAVIKNFGKIVDGGIAMEQSVTHSKTIDNTEIKNYERTVASATTENYGITLSNGWTDSMTVSEEFCERNGLTQEQARQYAVNESNNWYISSGSSGSKTTNTYSSDETTSLNTSTSHSEQLTDRVNEATKDSTYTDHDYQNYGFEEEVHAGGKIKGIVDVGGSVTANQGWGSNSTDTGEDFSKDFLNTKTYTSQDNYNENGNRSVTGSNSTSSASWSSESGKGGSKSVTETTSTATVMTQELSTRTGYGKTYINTGNEQTTQGLSSTSSNADRYSTGSTYSVIDQEVITETISTTNTTGGYHRWVWATTMHVFLVVGYDIATSSYFTCTTSIQDDNIYRFEDYSYDTPSYDDNQTSLITFEIPTDIEEYVAERMAGSEGLQFSRNGKVTGYTGTDDYVIIPEYKVINGTVIKVTGIDENAFKGKTTVAGGNTLKAIELSEYITEISDSAFEGCTALEFIDFKNVSRIGSRAFAGCAGLRAIKLNDIITGLGQEAFAGIDAVMVYASNKSVVEAVADSGAKAIVIVVSDGCSDLTDCTITIPEGTEFFEFYGKVSEPRNFNDVYIVSDANETAIINANFISTKKTPIIISSENVIWAESNVTAPNFDLVFTAENTNFSIFGEATFVSSKGDAVLTKNLTIDQIDDELYSRLHLNGNVLVCGSVVDNGYLSFDSGRVIPISAEDYQRYIRGTYTITFNANGGTLTETERVAYYGTQTDSLPTPTKDYCVFDGWYLENGSARVTPETLLSNAEDITLVAHWTDNPLSGWVEASQAPSDAQIVNTKYSYNSWKSSSSPTMSGYTRDDSRTTYTISWSNTEWYDSQQSTSETFRYVGTRSVENGTETYLYNYYNSSKGTTSMTPRSGFSEQGYWAPSSEVYWWDFYNGGWTTDYLRYELWGYPANKGDTRTVYKTQYGYQRGTKNYTYWFYKPVETTSQPTASSTVTNITKWIQYRPKSVDGNYTESNRLPFNGHTYVLYTSSSAIKWSDAKIWCEFAGGHLAVITSSAENNLVKSLTKDTLAWLGLSKTPASNWEWTNGEAFSYSDWKSGEPNCYSNNEWYAATLDRQWNDNPNSTTSVKAFVMEIEHA